MQSAVAVAAAAKRTPFKHSSNAGINKFSKRPNSRFVLVKLTGGHVVYRVSNKKIDSWEFRLTCYKRRQMFSVDSIWCCVCVCVCVAVWLPKDCGNVYASVYCFFFSFFMCALQQFTILLEDMLKLTIFNMRTKKTYNDRMIRRCIECSKCWQEYYVIFDGIVSIFVHVLAMLQLEIYAKRRNLSTRKWKWIHESQCIIYNLQANQHESKISIEYEVSLQFAISLLLFRDIEVSSATIHIYMCRRRHSFRFHFASYLFSNYYVYTNRTNECSIRKYQIIGKLEPLASGHWPNAMSHSSSYTTQWLIGT